MTDRLREEVLRFDPEIPIERAWQPPASWYVDADHHALERRAVFGDSWQAVARAADLERPGSFARPEPVRIYPPVSGAR